MVKRFSSEIRRRLRDADPAVRHNWLHLFVSKVVIGRDWERTESRFAAPRISY
ncbi:hypothetical protein DEVEQU_00166 [Devosia equisanguinis]|uniref:Uncharacterized protein n=1 Tax=Devosia equisanguinis TaxID=2490941 RepID=A0A447I6E7_9HYPH|nr:hypothetical protein DEVEQU_00166 [Devosia equisanguinis]